MASTSQIWPVEETTASTWTGPQRVSMVGPSTVLPSHAEPAAGCCVLEGAAGVACLCAGGGAGRGRGLRERGGGRRRGGRRRGRRGAHRRCRLGRGGKR